MPKENNIPHEWSAEGLLDEIQKLDTTMKDRSLAFILGAGASITSGIPAGGTLAQTWLKEIHLRQCLIPGDQVLEAWAAEKLTIPNFRLADAATHYSRIFELRFGGDPKSGYAALEAEMEKAEPGLGYSILAKILAETRHKVVVTTNFDNLVADALAINALQHPLIVGHESLTGFVRPQLPRPLVAKIHRDLHLHPKNDQNGVDTLEKGWEEALRGLFQHYTPLVIGYGGNDGSLMGFLENLPTGHIPGRLFWCYREGARPDERILKILVRHNGVLVAVAGFDEFMVQMAQRLFAGFELASIAQSIEELGKERAKRYQAQLEQLAKTDITPRSPTADKARQSISEASHDDSKWWTWELRARAKNDPDKRDAIYREAVSRLPNHPELAGNYALFLADQRKDYDAAEAMFKKALELDPNHANNTGNYAIFLAEQRKDYDAAEAMYKKALEIDPNNADHTGNYASFLANQRKDYDAAEALYKKALELDPNHANNTGNYAIFLAEQRKDYDAAEALYKKALELDPNDANNSGNYAFFLADQRKDYDAAEAMYKKALELDPNHANNSGNYALFLADQRKDYDAAEAMYKKALELDPNDANNTGNYAIFLAEQRKDYDAAEALYKKALEFDPNHANITGNYATFLANQRKDYDAAEAMYKKALELDPNDANHTANFASLILSRGDALTIQQVAPLVRKVIDLSEGHPSQAVAEALLYRCLYSELRDGTPGNCIGGLKRLLTMDFERGSWDFSAVFESVLPNTSSDRHDLYRAIGDAILNADSLPALDKFQLWRDTPPSDPFAPS